MITKNAEKCQQFIDKLVDKNLQQFEFRVEQAEAGLCVQKNRSFGFIVQAAVCLSSVELSLLHILHWRLVSSYEGHNISLAERNRWHCIVVNNVQDVA